MTRKDAYYFSHDSNARNDEKIIALRMKYDWKGYGLYWAIVEKLREGKCYKLSTDYNLIAYDLRCDSATIKSIVEDFGLFAFTENGECFYSESLCERMSIKDEKSQVARMSALRGWKKRKHSKSNANAMQTHSESNAKKGKETKGKEKKEKEIKENNIEDIYSFWNNLDLVKHRNLDKFKPSINSALKIYTTEEIKQAMQNYKNIINSKDHYWTSSHWTIEEFLTRKGGIDRFITDNKPFDTFKSKFRNNGQAEVTKPNMFTGLDDKDYSEGAF